MWQVLPTGLRPLEAGHVPVPPGRRRGAGGILRLWRIRSVEDLRRIRAWIRRRSAMAGCSPQLAWRIQVGVNEVATNALVHGGGGTCRVGWDEEGVRVRVASRLRVADVGHIDGLLQGLRRQGAWKGNGLRIAATYADSVIISAGEEGLEVWLDFRADGREGRGDGDRRAAGG